MADELTSSTNPSLAGSAIPLARLIEQLPRYYRSEYGFEGYQGGVERPIVVMWSDLQTALAAVLSAAGPSELLAAARLALNEIDAVRSEWAMKAATYARAQVTPLYQGDETPTSYERGQIQQVAAAFRDGYFAACDALERLAGAVPAAPLDKKDDMTRCTCGGILFSDGHAHTRTCPVYAVAAPPEPAFHAGDNASDDAGEGAMRTAQRYLGPSAAGRLRALIQELLAFSDWRNPDTDYCWYCTQDVNGKDGAAQPHADWCLGVKAEAALVPPGAPDAK